MSRRKPQNETPAQRAARVEREGQIARGYLAAKYRERAAKRARIASWATQTDELLARRREASERE